MAVKPHGLANRPGEPYPATFRKSVDPPRIELGFPPRQGGVVPLDHEPISFSGPAGESNPHLLVASQASSRWRIRARVVPDGLEPPLPGCRPGVVAAGPRDYPFGAEAVGLEPTTE